MPNLSPTQPSQLSPTEKPTIVIVQGSFQTPLVYNQLLTLLTQAGYPTTHPQLPSCTDISHPSFPQRTLIDDALAVRMEVTRLVEYESKKVVVLMHSYGGLVGSEAIPESLSYAHRVKEDGLPGGVIHLIYFNAFVLSAGQSVLGAFGESPNNIVKVVVKSTFTS
jgi:alpha-beta hydrolase superfamily lysophospholipase